MKIVPRNNGPKVAFYAQRLGMWEARAAEIGASPQTLAALREQVGAARAALMAQERARSAARSATLALHTAVAAMAGTGAVVLRQIRTRAATERDDRIYSLALVPAPRQPAPIGPPGEPTNFAVELTQVGTLKLTWACRNPAGSQGTMYQLSRQLDGTGPFTLLGVTGRKRMTDSTVPAGTAVVTYEIRAVRSTAIGPVARFPVRFGNHGTLPAAFSTTRRDATTIAA